MSNFLESLSTKDRVIFLGGGALLLLFLYKTLTGGSSAGSAVPNSGDSALTTANQTADAGEALAAQVTAQVNAVTEAQTKAVQTQTEGLAAMSKAQAEANAATTKNITDMFTAFGASQNAALASLGGALKADLGVQIVSQKESLNSLQTLINQMARTPVYSGGGGTIGALPTVGGSSQTAAKSNPTAGMVTDRSTSAASGYAVPLMTSKPHVTTRADLANVVGVSTSQQGYGLVTVKTATGTSSVLAGSVFDPTSPNYKPGSNG